MIYEGGLNRLPIPGPLVFLERGGEARAGGWRMRGQPLSQNSSSGCLLTLPLSLWGLGSRLPLLAWVPRPQPIRPLPFPRTCCCCGAGEGVCFLG